MKQSLVLPLASALCTADGGAPGFTRQTLGIPFMGDFDFEREFSEWVFIRDFATSSLAGTAASSSTSSSSVASPRLQFPAKDSFASSNVNGDIIFSLPEHIILSVLHYSCTDVYALYRYVFSSLSPSVPVLPAFLDSPCRSSCYALYSRKYTSLKGIIRWCNVLALLTLIHVHTMPFSNL